MSILIKGMEMPTSCGECPASTSDGRFGDLVCGIDWRTVEIAPHLGIQPIKPPEWCPLIPVPDHGRLIDADGKTFPTLHRNPSNDYMKGWNACLRSVQQQPTIIPAEEE